MIIYIAIFFSKILENALSTLRLIVVANGKKKLGAFLQGIVSLVWILVTGIVIIDINKDVFKIIFFCLGTCIGSYLGSIIEERLALGNNLIICMTKQEEKIIKELSQYEITSISEKNKQYSILLILLKRKKTNNIAKIIKTIDKDATIIIEKAKNITTLV